MLDNCKIWYYKPNVIDIVNKDGFNEHTKNGELYYSGMIKNLKVSINQDRIIIKNSIKKFINPNPEYDLTRKDIQRFIDSMNEILGVDISDAKLTVLESGLTISTNENPLKYVNLFGKAKEMVLTAYGINQKTYSKTKKIAPNPDAKSIKIYDKGLESKVKDNLLRIEFKVPKRVAEGLKLSEPLTLRYLTTENGYNLLFRSVINLYKLINKSGECNYNYKTPTQFTDFVYNTILNSEIGHRMFYDMNKVKKQNGEITDYTYQKIKTRLKNTFEGYNPNELIMEIESKVFTKYNYLLNN